MAEWLLAFYLQVPVVIGGVLHMVVVSRGVLPGLAVPVQRRLFGANKTWRGFVVVPLFTAAAALLLLPLEWQPGAAAPIGVGNLAATGFCAGLGYMLGELPNSFLKRRLGIAAGMTPVRGRAFFVFFDQVDSALGVALAYAFCGVAPLACLVFVLTFPLTALGVKRLLFMAQLKASPA